MRRVFRLPSSRARIASEVDAELAFHLDARVARLIASGLPPDAARTEALRQFGDVDAVRASMVSLDAERERASHRVNLWSDLRQDIRYAARALRRNVALTAVIVSGLGLGIGANTAVFTVIDALFFRPMSVREGDRLVAIGNQDYVGSSGRGRPRTDIFSAPLYRDIRDGNDVFSGVLATGPASGINVRVDRTGPFEHPHTRYVSGNFFSVLGVLAHRGRVFDARVDDLEGNAPVVTISHAYWMRRFQGDPSVIGRTMSINGVAMSIVGVASPAFAGEVAEAPTDVWLPLSMHDAIEPSDRVLDERSASWLLAIGRLESTASLELARQRIKPLIERSILGNADAPTAKAFAGRPHDYIITSGARGFSEMRINFETPLLTLLAGVGLLLCIMCANVANLLLARAVARGREMAVRLALGADRSRIVRQLMTESVLLAALGAGVGLVVAWWGSHGLLAVAADGEDIPLLLGVGGRVLAFTLGLAVVTVIVFGLAPALRASRVDLAQTFRASAHSISSGGLGARRLRLPLSAWLVVSQIAFSLVLLIGSAMLARSLRNVSSVDTGMDREHLVIANADIRARSGLGEVELADVTRRLRDRVAAIPGVASVSFSELGIFSGSEWSTTVQVPGFTALAPDDSVVGTDQIGAAYAQAIGARILAGRDMRTTDEDRRPRTVLVNDAFAKFYFPHADAVGRVVRFDDSVAVEIVGVISDVRNRSLSDPARRRVYFPFLHRGDTATVGAPGSLRLIVRTTGDPAALTTTIRRAMESVDRDLPIDRVDPLVRLMRATIREERLLARVATGFSVFALLLATVGLYGVMTYAITRRTGEIGLRVALGALSRDVVQMVLVDAFRLVGLGLVIGVPLAFGAARLLQSQLHDIGSTDTISFAIAMVALASAATLAAALPAARAAKVSPMAALKQE
jgi:predicted permease